MLRFALNWFGQTFNVKCENFSNMRKIYFTEQQIKKIISLLQDEKLPQAAVAERFGVSQWYISKALKEYTDANR